MQHQLNEKAVAAKNLQDAKDSITSARNSVRELTAPTVLMKASHFLQLNRLQKYERAKTSESHEGARERESSKSSKSSRSPSTPLALN